LTKVDHYLSAWQVLTKSVSENILGANVPKPHECFAFQTMPGNAMQCTGNCSKAKRAEFSLKAETLTAAMSLISFEEGNTFFFNYCKLMSCNDTDALQGKNASTMR